MDSGSWAADWGRIVKPVRNNDGTYGSIEYDKETGTYEYKNVQAYTQVISKPLPGFIKQGATMNEVSYGRLVRIPVANPREGHYVYEDVTVKTAKKRAKTARKLARQIEKACR